MQIEHEQIYPQPDWVEHDPVEIKETTALGAAFAAGLAIGVFGGLEVTVDDPKAYTRPRRPGPSRQ